MVFSWSSIYFVNVKQPVVRIEIHATFPHQVVLYQEMLAEAGITAPQPDKAGANGEQQTAGRFPTLKGFFR